MSEHNHGPRQSAFGGTGFGSGASGGPAQGSAGSQPSAGGTSNPFGRQQSAFQGAQSASGPASQSSAPQATPPQVPPPKLDPPKRRANPAMIGLTGLGVALLVVCVFVVHGLITAPDLPVGVPLPPSTTQPQTPKPTPTPKPKPSLDPTQPFTPPEVKTERVKPDVDGPYGDYPNASDNPVYDQKVGSWKCSGIGQAEAPQGDAIKKWVKEAMACMMKRYGPVVKAAGETLSEPKIIYHSGSIDTPCGRNSDTVPFYCSGDEAIYMNPDVVRKYSATGTRFAALHLIFHEFAHHVQWRLGIFDGRVADVEDDMQASRRLELQAECFTFLQIGQLTDPAWGSSDVNQFKQWFSVDQNEAHGKSASYLYWFNRAIGKGDFGLCNTWTAPKKRVA